MRCIPLLICFALSASCSSTPGIRDHAKGPLDGRWEGRVAALGAEGRLIVDFVTRGDSLIALATMNMEALWVDRPLENVRYDDPRIHFEFPARDGNGIFDGVRAGDSISGETKKNGRALPMTFRRISREVPAKPYRQEAVAFRSRDGTELRGTLTLPATGGRHPAIVFIHGSGPSVRADFSHLNDAFARAGFAALAYDKRGSGESGGNDELITYHDLASDVRAAVRMLAARADIDNGAIGIAGSSEGGWVAPIVASEAADSVAFVIAIVASGGTYFENGIYQNLARMERSGATEEQKTRYRELITLVSDVVRGKRQLGEGDRTKLNEQLAAAHREAWARVTDLPRSVPSGRQLQRLRWTMMDFDPTGYWKRVRAPVMLVLGANDRNVSTAQSIQRIPSALNAGGNMDVTTVVFPDVEHNLMSVPDTTPGKFAFPEPPAGYPDTLITWAKTKVRRPAPSRN